jgi:hypothetical protein
MCYIHAQLPPPVLYTLTAVFAGLAMLCAPFPRRVQHYAADNAYQYQAYAAEYKICSRAQPYKTCPQGLVACSRQEPHGAIRKRLHIQSRRTVSGLLCCRAVHCGCFVGVIVGGLARVRGSLGGVHHGGCIGANIGLLQPKGCPEVL